MKRIISYVLISILSVMLLPFGYVSADDSGEWWKTYDAADDAFDYYIDGDPMNITDEEFFGVWDDENYSWISEPCFSYDLYPGLLPVKEAAMDGDYELAKEELQAYYSSVKEERAPKVTNYPGSRPALTAYLLSKNAYTVDASGCGFVRDVVKFNNNWQTFKSSVSLSAKVVGINEYVGFGFFSVDKYPTQGEIKSRESGSPAKLELVINGGVSITLNACADGTVRGGTYEDTSYGYEDALKIQSSGTWRDFNEDTHYAYVKFDISFLKTTDIVESATLVFEGRNGSGTGEKEIVVYQPNLADWTEDNLTFNTYIDNVQYWSAHDENTWDWKLIYGTLKGTATIYYRGQVLHDVAALYSYSGNEEYAFTFLRQQMAYINKIGLNNERQNALDITVFLPYQSQDVFYVIDSPHTTPEIFTAMLKDMYIKAEWTCNDYYFTKSNNWGGYAASGVYNVISRFPELATTDEWLQKTKEQYTYLLDVFTFEDGMCLELPLNYITVLLGTIEDPVRVSAELDMELPFEDGVLNSIHGAVQTLIYCSGPDYSGNNVSDVGNMNNKYDSYVKFWYENVFTDDPEFEFVATGGKSGALPKNPTTHYPVGLRTYMRSAWADPNAFVMMLTGKGTGSHRDNDVLSTCMFAYGQYLLTDQGYATRASFTDDVKGYFGHAARHNLVTINGQDHDFGTRDATELAFESNMQYDFIEYSAQNYVKARQQRSALYLKEQKFWIVTDFEEPVDKEEVIVYEQLWHMLPEANMTLDPKTYEARSNMSGTANVIVTPVDIYDATASMEHSRYVTGNDVFEDSKKADIRKEGKGDKKYTTIIYPVDINDDYSIDVNSIELDGDKENINAFAAKITNELTGDYDNYYFCHHNIPQGRQPVTLGAFETDASTALIQLDKDGNVVSAFLMDATYLRDNSRTTDKDLFVSKTPVKAISYRFAGKTTQIESSVITDSSALQEITIYVGDKNYIILNDEEINSNKSGGYVYFADTPIVEGTEITPDKPNGSTTGGHGTGGGGGGGSASVVKPKPEDNKENEDNKDDENQVIVPPVSTDTVPTNIAKELKGHWGEDEITSLYKSGIVTGDANGLRLKDSISRAEFVALIVRALGLGISEYNNTFFDVDFKDWHASYIATAYDAGLIGGSKGMFRPDDTITREEMCKIIACATDVEYELKQVEFRDNDSISPWALEYINKVYSLGIVNGMDDGTFAPKNNALREQAFMVLARLQNIINK